MKNYKEIASKILNEYEIKMCDACGKFPKTSNHPSSKYCIYCKDKMKKKKNAELAKRIAQKRKKVRESIVRQCKHCGKDFNPAVHTQTFCNPTCRREYNNKKRRRGKVKKEVKVVEKKVMNKESIVDESGKIDPYFLRRGKIYYGRKEY